MLGTATVSLVAPAAATTIGTRRAVGWGAYAGGLWNAFLARSHRTVGLRLARGPRGALLRWALISRAAIGRSLLVAGLALGAGGDGGERNAATRLIDIDDPDLEYVADTDDLVRVADETVRQTTDVNEAAIGEADIQENAKIDDIEDCARQLHTRGQVFELHDPAPEEGRGKIVARIKGRAGERSEDVLEQVRPDGQLGGELRYINGGGALGDDAAGRGGGLCGWCGLGL